MDILRHKDPRFSPTAEPYRKLVGQAALFNNVSLEGIHYIRTVLRPGPLLFRFWKRGISGGHRGGGHVVRPINCGE